MSESKIVPRLVFDAVSCPFNYNIQEIEECYTCSYFKDVRDGYVWCEEVKQKG